MRDHTKSTSPNKHIYCAHCGTQNAVSNFACSRCGERLTTSRLDIPSNIESVSCPQCHDTNDIRSQYCRSCGAEMLQPIPVDNTPKVETQAASQNQIGKSPPITSTDLIHPPSDSTGSEQTLKAETKKTSLSPDEEITEQNTSGRSNGKIPPDIKRWNWAAFLMPAVWGLFSGVPFTGLLFAAAFLPSTAQLLIMITASLFLGFKGNELAWRGKKWQAVEHFNSFQQQWTSWSIRLSAAIGAILIIFIFTQTGG